MALRLYFLFVEILAKIVHGGKSKGRLRTPARAGVLSDVLAHVVGSSLSMQCSR